ncbi:MAG: hypothetical protein ACRYFK_14470 [Janthinobacterium lividum]
MPKQTPQQYAAFQALCRANQLDPKADVWQQKQSGQWIIGRTGIEKIQGLNNIGIELDVVGFGIDFAGVKCTATRTVKAEGTKTGKKLSVVSLGSAHPKSCSQISYYLEMAEKRAKSRAVLMLMGFYALGIYGEDEADDFQRKADSLPGQADTPPVPALPVGNEPAATPAPSATPAASSSAALVASTGAAPNIAGPAEIPAEILAKYERQFEAVTSGIELKRLWDSLTKNEATALFAAKEVAKARLAAGVEQAKAVVTQPEAGNIKEAGSDSALVDEYVQQPTMLSGTFGPATTDQKQEIQRLLNHPKIFRKEKTQALLGINKLDTERARQLLTKLRTAITEREGYTEPTEAEEIGAARAKIASLLKQHAGKLEIEDEGKLRAVLANAKATLDELQATLRWGLESAWDAETDGTEREQDEAEKMAA